MCFLKTISIIYADLESLIEKINGRENYFGKPFTAKVGDHIPCGYSMSVIWTFNDIGNKHDIHEIKYCMKKFFESLR